jgi:1,6-anhydro-N-acetylmuramate kinase
MGKEFRKGLNREVIVCGGGHKNCYLNRGSCKSLKSPFDKLRVNGGRVEIMVTL